MIDRIAPTRRPDGPVRGFQRWRSLLFMHWSVPLDVLRPRVPDSLEIDQFDGVAYVGVVPFAMEGVRPKWLPGALAFTFLETNVRTYVLRDGQPGVYFFSLDAASGLAAWAARQFWGLPYFHAKMSLQREASSRGEADEALSAGDTVLYRSSRVHSDVSHRVRYVIGEPLGPAPPDSLEFFFLERYLLFVERKDAMFAGQVHHRPYPAHLAEVVEVEDQLLSASGIATASQLPKFAHFSPGVDVEVFDLKRV